MLTPSDIRDPKLKSGFRFVGYQHDKSTKPYHAQIMNEFGPRKNWYGPWRDTPEEAAQDYCDYVNGQRGATPAPQLKSAGHQGKRDRIQRTPEEIAALGVLKDARGRRKGKQGFVYLIGEVEGEYALKIGFSTKPVARPAELQTGNPRPLVLIAQKPGTEADERALHAKFAHLNILQEWFEQHSDIFAEFGIEEVTSTA